MSIHPAVVEIDIQRRPAAEHVADGLGQLGAAGQPAGFLLQPHLQVGYPWGGFRLCHHRALQVDQILPLEPRQLGEDTIRLLQSSAIVGLPLGQGRIIHGKYKEAVPAPPNRPDDHGFRRIDV
jgi:hypothetical protein